MQAEEVIFCSFYPHLSPNYSLQVHHLHQEKFKCRRKKIFATFNFKMLSCHKKISAVAIIAANFGRIFFFFKQFFCFWNQSKKVSVSKINVSRFNEEIFSLSNSPFSFWPVACSSWIIFDAFFSLYKNYFSIVLTTA